MGVIKYIRVNRKKAKWLNQRGGRDFSDVRKDKNGEYVFMVAKDGKREKVYLPFCD